MRKGTYVEKRGVPFSTFREKIPEPPVSRSGLAILAGLSVIFCLPGCTVVAAHLVMETPL
jgi:hypothetical protein